MTDTQKALCKFVDECQKKGFTPTLGDMAEAMHCSKENIRMKLMIMERNGDISRTKGRTRIAMLNKDWK